MTTTTTDQSTADDTDLLGDALRAEQESAAKSLATIQPTQQRFTEDQVAILRQLGIEDATDGDLNLFFHYCRTTGLDPFRKQIYMIGRNTKISEWVDQPSGGRTKVEKWVTKYTIQTGIDGYRRNGREAAKRLADELRFEGPLFTGENDFHVTDDGQVIQHWREVWPKGKPPHAAKFVIYRNGEPFEGVAHYDEFVQTFGNGGEPNSMWAKMPRNQIAKCAEALAWRRAYPDDFAGLILEDSAQPTVIDQDGNVERRGARRAPKATTTTVDEIFTEPAEAPQDAEVVEQEPQPTLDDLPADDGVAPEPQTAPAPAKSARRKAAEKRVFTLIGDIKPPVDRDDRITIYRSILKRDEITSTDDLSDADLKKVGDKLYTWSDDGDLDAQVRDLLNAADLRAAAKEEGQQ
ncbi:RecT family recombinase [Mycobacterium sp. TJFP1]